MNRLLFVYGTLKASYRGTFGRAMRDRLAAESRPLGAARLQGRLYDLGRYPGVVDSAETGELVHGELVELAGAEASFAWLDPYESIRTDRPELSEYQRVERSVRLDQAGNAPVGGDLVAWVYLYAQDLGRARHVASGQWEG